MLTPSLWIQHVSSHLIHGQTVRTYIHAVGTNCQGYELYTIAGEANGQSVPLAFIFIATIKEDYETGNIGATVREVIRFVKAKCPKWHFTIADKDPNLINPCRAEHPEGKHQNCYWHGVKYVRERLAEDKAPAAYSPYQAHLQFDFIDPTWAPGISSGLYEEGVHPKDFEKTSGPKNIVSQSLHKQQNQTHLS
jgi:hypothetical protein